MLVAVEREGCLDACPSPAVGDHAERLPRGRVCDPLQTLALQPLAFLPTAFLFAPLALLAEAVLPGLGLVLQALD